MKRVFGGGVCIYVGGQFKSFSERVSRYSIISPNFEIVTVSITKPNNRKMLVMCIYKPPTGKIDICINFLREILADPVFSKYEIWLLGDFNVDILKRDDAKTILLQEFVKKSGLFQKIDTVTRPNKNGGSCIDLIITNCPFVKSKGTLNDFVSDHYTVYCIRKKIKENNECLLKCVRNYKNYNQEDFEVLLQGKDWSTFDISHDPNVQWNCIFEHVIDILSIMCPYKMISVRKSPTPWITPDIFNMINQKRALTRQYKSTRSQNDLQELRILRNKLNTSVDKAKSTYITENLYRNCKNPKKFWRIIKDLIEPSTGCDIEAVTFINPLTGQHVIDEDKPNFLNEFFARIAEKTCDLSKVIYPEIDLDIEVGFDFQPPELDDLIHLIKDIDVNTSSCVDGINMKMCKRVISIIPERFLLMYANSMYHGIFPSKWSVSTVTLLPKTGNNTDPGNWRPISNTNIFAKILEKLVHKQISRYVFTNNIISDFQFGFVPGRSTHEAIFKFVKNIYSAINNNKFIGVLFLDIAKAFNCINHRIFDIILANHGFDPRVRRWFTSYNTRFQCTKVGDIKSDIISVLHGAAQGTVLGPTIFILYFDAISKCVSRCKLFMFADDCVIYQTGNTWDTIRGKLQLDLNEILQWTSENSLSLNGNKTQAIIFGPRAKLSRIQNPDPIMISDVSVKFVKQYSYLGVTLDREMSLHPLIKGVKKSITNKIFNLRKIRKYITEKAALVIYKQTILPILDYSGFILLSCGKGDRFDLQKIQNDILRVCCKIKWQEHVSIKDLHKRCKIISIEQRMRRQLLWLMYIESKNVDNRKIFERELRNADKYVFKTDRKIGTKYQHSPFYKGTLLWNDLSADIQFSRDIFEFKKLIARKYMIYENLLETNV